MQSLYHEPPLSPVSISALAFAISSHDKFRSAAMRNEAFASAMGFLRPSPSWLARRPMATSDSSLARKFNGGRQFSNLLAVAKKAPETPKMQEPSLTHDPEYADRTTATAPLPDFAAFSCLLAFFWTLAKRPAETPPSLCPASTHLVKESCRPASGKRPRGVAKQPLPPSPCRGHSNGETSDTTEYRCQAASSQKQNSVVVLWLGSSFSRR
jgi:hypothetical protein